MGRVLEALDQREGRRVAVKTLRASSPADRRHMEAEVRTLSRLQHQGIVRFLDTGICGDEIFLTMEVCDGVTLDRFLELGLPGSGAIRWLLKAAMQLSEALAYLHSCDVIHGDLKPANIVVLGSLNAEDPSDESRLRGLFDAPNFSVKILDFGLAKNLGALLQPGETAAGTPLYMSPEQLRVQATERSDLYSLGALLYHLVTGKPPFPGLSQILSGKSPPRPGDLNPACLPALSQLILRLLAREPHDRLASASEVREHLLDILEPGRPTTQIPDRLLPTVFVGRVTELNRLSALVASAAARKGSSLRIGGPRGSGKSWLLRESGIIAEALADHGVPTFRLTFSPGNSSFTAFSTLFDDLSSLEDTSGPEPHSASPLTEALKEWKAAVAEPQGPDSPPLPAWTDDGSGAAAKILRDRRVDAALKILCAACQRPLFLQIEDVQHAGELEIEILGRLSRRARDWPVALVVTHRTDSQKTSEILARWLQDFDTNSATGPILLAGLSDGEVAKLVERRLYPTSKISPALMEALTKRSEGNPLALSRWLEILWGQGHLRRADGDWQLAQDQQQGDLPPESLWGPLFRAIPEADRALLTATSILGTPSSAATLGRVAGLEAGSIEGESLQASLRRLAKKGLLAEDRDGFRPTPDLEDGGAGALAMFGVLGAKAIEAFHARAAASILESSGASDGHAALRIARHLERSGNPYEAARYYSVAGRHFANGFLNTLAIDAYQRALALSDSQDLQGEIEEGLGDLHGRLGHYAVALQRLGEALSKRGVSLSLLDKIGRVLHRQGELTQATRVFTECLESAGENEAARALALLRLGGLLLERGQAAEARDRLEESLSICTRLGDVRQTARVQFSLGVAEKQQDRPDIAALRFEEALRNAERSGSVLEAATTLNNLGNIHRALGDEQRAIDCLRRSMTARESMGDRQGIAIVLNNIAQVHLMRGELPASRAATESSLQIFAEVGDKRGILIARSNLGATLLQLGQLQAAREQLEAVTGESKRLQLYRILESALCTLGALELDAGYYPTSAEHVREALRSIPEDKPIELRAHALSLAAAVSLKQNNREAAEDAFREASFLANEIHLRGKLGLFHAVEMRLHLLRGEIEEALKAGQPHLTHQGSLDKLHWGLLHVEAGKAYRELGPDWADRAERELTRAIRIFESMPSPLHAAEARIELGIYWRLLGEDLTSEDLFRSAREELNSCGASQRIEELNIVKDLRP